LTRGRVAAVDILRGLVMVLMSIDHVRVYAGISAAGSAPAVFFTRWITHFCAPTFVLLAGASAWFYSRRHDDLRRHLLLRGALLVVLELTILRLAWTFDPNLQFMAGVIWVIGWCMILLAGLSWLPLPVVAATGLLLVAGHNLVDTHLDELIPLLTSSPFSGVWKVLYLGFHGGPIALGSTGADLIVLYSIIPWIGVMACGFTLGSVLSMERVRRDRICTLLGWGCIAAFLLLRGFNLYGDPRPWRAESAADGLTRLMAVLNTTKYPASLAFLLMTLGPVLAAIPLVEGRRGAVWSMLSRLGRVPFFYYLLHIPLIHALALLVCLVRTGDVSPWLFANHPMRPPPIPEGYTWSLWWLYGVVIVANVLLYPACRWYEGLEGRKEHAWLRYL